MEFITTGQNRYRVQYDSWMDGGGTWFGQEYSDIIRQRYPDRIFQRCYEWCAGPAYIGFNILDHGLCQGLTVSDIYGDAIAAVNQTIKINKLSGVSAYATGLVADLPDHELFDLVVANPPHFLECPGDDNYQRIAVDQNWAAHQEFFANIKQHLLPNGIILLQENQAGSLNREKDFESYIEQAGLEITAVFNSPEHYTPNHYTQIYYIEIKQKSKFSLA
jgi:methylase of polypeptide subunit release factors